MKKIRLVHLLLTIGLAYPLSANAWFFFFFPLPTGWPSSLSSHAQKLTDSDQTKALAYVGEDKIFGQKYYVWGSYIGDLSQKEAVKLALDRCNRSLERAKSEMLDGQPRWNFGNKKCELYGFPQLPETAVMPKEDEVTVELKPIPDSNWVEPGTELPFDLKKTTPAIKTTTPGSSRILESKPLLESPSNTYNPPVSDPARRLGEIKSLLDKGLITQQDYNSKKAEILKSM
jgi:hypothetical protein